MKSITSLTNINIKRVVSLNDRREREKTGFSVAVGRKEVGLLLNNDFIIKELYCLKESIDQNHEQINLAAKKGAAVYSIPVNVFEKISYGKRVDDLLAVFVTKYDSLDIWPVQKNSLFVVIEQIEKPGNLGAILRTCDAAAVSGVIISDGKTDLYNPNVVRSSLGTVFTQKIAVTSNDCAGHFLKENNIQIITTNPVSKLSYTELDYRGSCAIVLGSEKGGLSRFWLELETSQVSIPMLGQADSLNVSISTAILLYETIRQRKK